MNGFNTQAAIERNGTGIERNGTGIERNGTGIERNGTGIERNGTGIGRTGAGWLLALGLLACILAGPVAAEVEAEIGQDVPEVMLIGDTVVLSLGPQGCPVLGSATLRQGYASFPLIELDASAQSGATCGSSSIEVDGDGTGGKVDSDGTGDKSIRSVVVWGHAELVIDEVAEASIVLHRYDAKGALVEFGVHALPVQPPVTMDQELFNEGTVASN